MVKLSSQKQPRFLLQFSFQIRHLIYLWRCSWPLHRTSSLLFKIIVENELRTVCTPEEVRVKIASLYISKVPLSNTWRHNTGPVHYIANGLFFAWMKEIEHLVGWKVSTTEFSVDMNICQESASRLNRYLFLKGAFSHWCLIQSWYFGDRAISFPVSILNLWTFPTNYRRHYSCYFALWNNQLCHSLNLPTIP